jgi:hypothetical protein
MIADPTGGKPMSGAFDDNPDPAGQSAMSVYVEEKLLQLGLRPEDVLNGYEGYGLVALTVDVVRSNNLGIVWAPDPDQGPIGQAHADVYCAKTHARKRRLRDACEKVVWPFSPVR